MFVFSLVIDILMITNSDKFGFRTINSGRRTPHLSGDKDGMAGLLEKIEYFNPQTED